MGEYTIQHYLDNSATTAVTKSVADEVVRVMTTEYGNPSSMHSMGYCASEILENSRKVIAKSMNADPKEVYFTSGGTEGNNLAILGTAELLKKRGNKIVTTAVEHSSVMESMKHLEAKGFEVIYLVPTNGVITMEQLSKAIDDKTILVSIMTVNNETGTIFDTSKVKNIINRNNSPALLHTDFVQAYGKIPLNVRKLNCDILTVSGHKIHAPKGVGAIYLKGGHSTTRIKPIHFGGEQEKKLRPGTEPLPLIAGMAQAVREFKIDDNYSLVKELNQYARENIAKIKGVTFNSDDSCLPYVLNISTNCVKSQTMLNFLAEKNIFVSAGSACAKGKLTHALLAFGIDRKAVDSAIRLSFSNDNTKEDIDAFCKALKEGINTLVHY